MAALIQKLVGDVDTYGIELVRLVRVVANQYEAAVDEELGAEGLSGPRWALLMRLTADEDLGSGSAPECRGASPSHLSRSQQVSRNTISSLLRGLEEQGLIERELDPTDKRGFRIRPTEAGRQIVQRTAGHIAFMNDLAADLTSEERTELMRLLAKLHRSLATHGRGV